MISSGPAARRTQAWQAAGLLLLVAAALLVLYLIDPFQLTRGMPCPFRALTGYLCPGCGSTRAMRHLLHGHPLLALRHNLLAVLAAPWLLVSLGRYAWTAFSGRPLKAVVLPAALIMALFWVVLAFWVLRNLSGWPWTLLAPPAP